MKQIPWTFTFPFDNGDSKSVTGYTPLPEKGVDYYTPADQEAIVQQVIAALGTPVFGRVDENNNIILTGDLADGTYSVKYEDADGNTTDIGSITFNGYTGPVTSDVPLEWELGVKLSKTDNTFTTVTYDPNSATNSYAASQHIPVEADATYTFMHDHSTWNITVSVCYFNASGGFVSYAADVFATETQGTHGPVSFTPVSGAATMRLRVYSSIDKYGGDLATRLACLSLTKTV